MFIMRYIRQTKDTFIRRYGNIGYITNQLTKHDLNFNETGADFLVVGRPVTEATDPLQVCRNIRAEIYNAINGS